MFDWVSDPSIWMALVTLTVLEIVLGIDNIIFISILSGRLPEADRSRARSLGLLLALITRVALLLSINWVLGLKRPLFEIGVWHPTGRDLILFGGGLFLIWKSVHEIHQKLEGEDHAASNSDQPPVKTASFSSVIVQILILDIVFSLDSVITAVGMAKDVGVMIAAVIIAVFFMLAFAGSISRFVERHPTVKMLALAFLVLIGVNLLAESFHAHVEKAYTYFAMAFATGVELLNIRARTKTEPVQLHRQEP